MVVEEVKEEEPCIVFHDITVNKLLEEPEFIKRWTSVKEGSKDDKIQVERINSRKK